MDITMWLIAGAFTGWLGFTVAGFNDERGRMVSILIGAAGGLLGGMFIAPMFGIAAAVAGSYNVASVVVATVVAAAFLAAGNLIQNHWGI